MTAINAGRGERTTVLLQTNVGHDKRYVTDKFWVFLIPISYFIFVVLYPLVVEYDDRTGCQSHSNISAVPNQNSTFLNNKTDGNVTCENVTFINTTVEYALTHVWGKNWFIDAITLNVGFLDAHYEESGSIVIWAYVLVSICLVLYSFASMRTNHLYCLQIELHILVSMMVTFIIRTIHLSSKNFDATQSGLCLWYWPIPEIVLFIVMRSKSPPRSCEQSSDKEDNGIPAFDNLCLCPMLFSFVLYFLISNFVSSLNEYKLNWDNQLSYVFFGTICYMCLIFYYFVLMVVTCATNRSIDLERKVNDFGDFFRAWFIVFRYHLGTVCYHATLVFPRIHATFVMFEEEFRENRKLTLLDRIYLTHWKIPNLASTMTAARGHSTSDSIRELLRIFTSDSPRLTNYQNYNQILISFTTLSIATSNLIVISLWAHGVVLDPRFLMGISVSYFVGTFIQYPFARYCDAVADAACLYSDRSDVADF